LTKYNKLESKLSRSAENVIGEFTRFIEEVVKPRKAKVERANELLEKTLAARRPVSKISLFI